MNKAQALNQFWNSFGLAAYDETTVPDNTPLPYITYEFGSDDFGHTLARTASLWYRSNSWKDITEKEQQIAAAISRGGKIVSYDGGAFVIQKASPWAQHLAEPSDRTIRRIVLNVTIEFLD